jgi:FtsH-binding integral membrane protein
VIRHTLAAGAYYAALGINFALILVLACCRKTTQVVPWNYVLLGAFTLAESYLVGTISSFYDTNAVLLAFGICIGITIALTVFAFQTKIDFSELPLVWTAAARGFRSGSQPPAPVPGAAGLVVIAVSTERMRRAVLNWCGGITHFASCFASPAPSAALYAGVLVVALWSLVIFGFLMIWFRSQVRLRCRRSWRVHGQPASACIQRAHCRHTSQTGRQLRFRAMHPAIVCAGPDDFLRLDRRISVRLLHRGGHTDDHRGAYTPR